MSANKSYTILVLLQGSGSVASETKKKDAHAHVQGVSELSEHTLLREYRYYAQSSYLKQEQSKIHFYDYRR